MYVFNCLKGLILYWFSSISHSCQGSNTVLEMYFPKPNPFMVMNFSSSSTENRLICACTSKYQVVSSVSAYPACYTTTLRYVSVRCFLAQRWGKARFPLAIVTAAARCGVDSARKTNPGVLSLEMKRNCCPFCSSGTGVEYRHFCWFLQPTTNQFARLAQRCRETLLFYCWTQQTSSRGWSPPDSWILGGGVVHAAEASRCKITPEVMSRQELNPNSL